MVKFKKVINEECRNEAVCIGHIGLLPCIIDSKKYAFTSIDNVTEFPSGHQQVTTGHGVSLIINGGGGCLCVGRATGSDVMLDRAVDFAGQGRGGREAEAVFGLSIRCYVLLQYW